MDIFLGRIESLLFQKKKIKYLATQLIIKGFNTVLGVLFRKLSGFTNFMGASENLSDFQGTNKFSSVSNSEI